MAERLAISVFKSVCKVKICRQVRTILSLMRHPVPETSTALLNLTEILTSRSKGGLSTLSISISGEPSMCF